MGSEPRPGLQGGRAVRPHEIDEAMHRRITMAFEFRRPDHLQRLEIWKKQLPAAAALKPDVNLPALALKYELSGGYIRNAVQAALSKATSRTPEGEPITLCQADLLAGAALQLRGALRLKDQDRQRVPRRGLEDVLLQPSLKEQLDKIVQHEKARAVLVGQWGFGAGGDLSGTVCLFHGPPGTGKTMAAEAVGYETGRPLKAAAEAAAGSDTGGAAGEAAAPPPPQPAAKGKGGGGASAAAGVGGVVCMADLVAEAAEEANRGDGAMAQQVRHMYM
ncbi:hypothetical protein GPECTOR_2g1166 [Gonium pectorale]|uniref:ATPase AAA-type core domain-containing protein n=1 Tax=Gonium pectorale TaxID=33097 RepID=A0A150H0B8_GONPE|nr:hypothetical protein GPECTOR_2g1166 [Gonium pectorale]|eukprot:KXZ55616.1 hypothetical protein GPECTOR_2g1166 [Gonium pectorale]